MPSLLHESALPHNILNETAPALVIIPNHVDQLYQYIGGIIRNNGSIAHIISITPITHNTNARHALNRWHIHTKAKK